MISIAVDAFKRITNKYSITSAFYYLKKFEDSKVNDLIKEYVNHPDYLRGRGVFLKSANRLFDFPS
jgi:hypothetical protein